MTGIFLVYHSKKTCEKILLSLPQLAYITSVAFSAYRFYRWQFLVNKSVAYCPSLVKRLV